MEIFIHLRTHSAYSLSLGAIQVSDLLDLAINSNQPALALTDNNNLFGALEFSEKAASLGIQPIIGVQINIKDSFGINEVVLISTNEIGYRNISDIVGLGYFNSLKSGQPFVTYENLSKKSEGIILLSGGVSKGFISYPIKKNLDEVLLKRLNFLQEQFENNFFIELQRFGSESEKNIETKLLEIAYQRKLPLVATNDVFFRDPSMQEAHEVLMCIESGMTISNKDRPKVSQENYFKKTNEMLDLFKDIPEAILNTSLIAQKCSFRPQISRPILPVFKLNSVRNEKEELKFQSRLGLEKKLSESEIDLNDPGTSIYFERLDHELNIICEMGFAGYYFIVSDVVAWAKSQKIPVGPGRGSGAGSLVSWSLDITGLDPIKWGLLFERFLNPERISMPDFDIDFCKFRRDEVIRYVQKKYGQNNVAQIITFGELKSRAVIRDTGRVLEMPYGQVDKIAKLIPYDQAKPLSIEIALKEVKELKLEKDKDEQVSRLLSLSKQLEGLYRHASTHASGVVIGDKKISEIVPLYYDPKSEMPITQFNMEWVEKAGLVKFDFLGLQNLSLINKTIELINQHKDIVNMSNIPLDDKKTFEMLSNGDSLGVFQLESSGMRDILVKLKPEKIEEIIAIVSLFRPGPMENIPNYIERKNGSQVIDYLHPKLEPILKETYGILIYQEQVQQAAQILAGYSLGSADILRRAMGKKKKSEMAAQREKFVNGAKSNSISEDQSNFIFDQMSAFAGYGFNKSHAAGYALIAYQTAWLKCHYPLEFFAGIMSLEINDSEKLSNFINELKLKKINLTLPNVNESSYNFNVKRSNDDKKFEIVFSLSCIKNVGFNAIYDLVQEREKNKLFLSLEDFAKRIPYSLLNKRAIENLIKSGALDCFQIDRSILINSVENIISFSDMHRRENLSSQSSLFSSEENQNLKIRLNADINWNLSKKLQEEYSVLGFYISAHPLDSFNLKFENLNLSFSDSYQEFIKDNVSTSKLKFIGIISNIQFRTSKTGNQFGIVTISDKKGSLEFFVFNGILNKSIDVLKIEKPIFVEIEAKRVEGERIKLNAIKIEDLEVFIQSFLPSDVDIKVYDLNSIELLKNTLDEFEVGTSKIKLIVNNNVYEHEIVLDKSFKLNHNQRERINQITGIEII